MLGKYRAHLGLSTSVLLPLLAAFACSGADSAQTGHEPVSESSEAIGVAIANGCMVFWDKINYDTPLNNDAGELIELRVVKNAGSTATTLGQCGLAGLVLLNGDNCQPYATINLSAVAIPNDGFVQICDTAWNAACDVDRPQNWLQNDNEALVFLGPGFTPLLHASWENVGNTKVCLPAEAGAIPSIVVPTENNSTPDLLSVWCSGGFQSRAAASAGIGMAYTCGADGGLDATTDGPGADAGLDAATDGAGGSGGTATGGTGGTATGGTGGTATGGSGGTATGGSGGTATGGTGGTATGGSGGTATGGSGGTATGGSGGTATGGAAGTGTGGSATGGAAGAGTGGAAGTGTGGAAGAGTGGAAGAGTGGASTGGAGTGGAGTGGAGTGGAGTGGKADGGPSGGSDSDDDGGCGCRVPAQSSPASGSLLALLGAALVFMRRRR